MVVGARRVLVAASTTGDGDRTMRKPALCFHIRLCPFWTDSALFYQAFTPIWVATDHECLQPVTTIADVALLPLSFAEPRSTCTMEITMLPIWRNRSDPG